MLIPEELRRRGHQRLRFRCVLMEEFARVGATSISSGFGLQDDIAIPYIVEPGTDEQKARWLRRWRPGSDRAIAMTEPGRQ